MNNLQINNVSNNITSYPKTSAPIAFKGANKSVQPTDTVEISSKKKSNNLAAKLLFGGLAIGGAIFAWIKLHKPEKAQEVFKSEFKNIENIRKNLSEIFEKDFTEKEADELAKSYKKICGIKDDNEFVEKLFEQLKNDYGFKNSHLKLEFEDFNSINKPHHAAAHLNYGDKVTVTRVDGNLFGGRKLIFSDMFHELKHHKQFETAIATDQFAYEMAIAYNQMITRYTEEEIAAFGGRMTTLDSLMEQGKPLLKPEFERIEREIGQFPESSPLYQRGLEYIEATKNYPKVEEIPQNEDKYFNNILEKEAHIVGDLAKEIFGWLT